MRRTLDLRIGRHVTVMYGGAAVGYGSKRQQRQHRPVVYGTEAEIMAASLAAAEVMYFRGLLREMGRDLPPTKLYVDNQGAIELSKDGCEVVPAFAPHRAPIPEGARASG